MLQLFFQLFVFIFLFLCFHLELSQSHDLLDKSEGFYKFRENSFSRYSANVVQGSQEYLDEQLEKRFLEFEQSIRQKYDGEYREKLFKRRTLQELQNLTVAPPNLPPAEIDSLYAFWNSTRGYQWRYGNGSLAGNQWDFSEDPLNPCENHWEGLLCRCNQTICHVLYLSLPEHNLYGYVPPQIGNLTQLEKFDLEANAVTGTIPVELFQKCKFLTIINLYANYFIGSIPSEIDNVKESLQVFDLGLNRFTGTLPETLYNLHNLKVCYLGFNLFHGTISTNLQYLTSLEVFRIKLNNFSREFPWNSLSYLTNLTVFDISNNTFIGTVPNPFGYNCCHSMALVDLGQNQFTGLLPSFDVNNLNKNLKLISFNRNHFIGTIPSNVINMTSLEWYSIQDNLNITGTIPSLITNLRSLATFLISQNQLHGEVTMLTNMTQLQFLDIHENYFYGQIYNVFQYTENFLYFAVNENFFSGPCPGVFNATVNWKNLIFYIVNNNSFTSTIPYLASTVLREFKVGNNFLTGHLGAEIFKVPTISYLNFEVNQLSGSLLPINNKITLLIELYGYSNYLTGTLPTFLQDAPRLVNLQFSYNYLSGSVNENIFYLPKIQTLFLQYNFFDNGIELKNNITSQLLTSVDISHNSFTGSLPFRIFSSKIQTFAACSNCFDGSISSDICVGTGLTALALDGVSTASPCRQSLFPSWFFGENNELSDGLTPSFVLKKSLKGKIPNCLYELPNIQTLHLSGNDLTGSIPSNINISNSLTDLSLSHNELTGTIPNNIQNKSWNSLDLSNNKFTGILSDDILANSLLNETTLDLYVNLLSGSIPSKLLSMENINILQGNLFSCGSSSSFFTNPNDELNDLPSNDPSALTYDCGSSLTNDPLYIYCLLSGIFIMFSLITLILFRWTNYLNRRKQQFQHLLIQIKLWKEMLLKERLKSANISSTIYQLQSIRMIVFRITMFIVLILLPMYGGLSSFASTYRFKYAWTISSAFLSGKSAGIVLFVVYFVYLMFCYLQLDFYFSRNNKQPEKDRGKEDEEEKEEGSSEKHEGNAEQLDRATAIQTASSSEKSTAEDKKEVGEKQGAQESASKKKEKAAVGWNHYLVWFFVALIDIVLMVLVNILYVVAVVNPITINFIVFLQLILAIFKVIWNDYILWKLIPAMRYSTKAIYKRYILPVFTSSNDNPSIISPSSSSSSSALRKKQLKAEERFYQLFYTDYPLLSSDLFFILILILFNNIIAPFFSIAIISPDCFYYAFFQAPSVDSSYPYCDYYFVLGTIVTRCVSEAVVETTYTPPYSYSYQCSSELPVNYSPVYIYMFIFLGFLQPMSKILMKWIYDGIWERYLLTHRPSSRIDMAGASTKTVQSPASDAAPVTSSLSSSLEEGSAVERERSRWESQQYNQLKKENWLFRFLDELLPEHMKQLKTFEEFQFLFAQRKQQQQRSSLFFMSFSGPSTVSPPSPSAIDEGLKEEKIRSKSKNSSHANERNNSLQKHVLIHTQNIEILRMKRLFVKLFSYVGILLSFGTLFPPLAVIICISIFLIVSLEELMIGRVLYESQERGWAYHWYEEQIHYECNSFQHKLISMHISWVYMILMCLIFSYILFDTIGIALNWQGAIIPTMLFLGIPVGLWICRFCYRYVMSYRKKEKNNENDSEIREDESNLSRGGIELSHSLSLTLQEAESARPTQVSSITNMSINTGADITSPQISFFAHSTSTNLHLSQHIRELQKLQTLAIVENPMMDSADPFHLGPSLTVPEQEKNKEK